MWARKRRDLADLVSRDANPKELCNAQLCGAGPYNIYAEYILVNS